MESISSEILDGGHDGAHTFQRGAVVDGAGGGEVKTPQVVLFRGLAVPLYLGDNGILVVVHEGEGRHLAVNTGVGHQPADLLDGNGGAEVTSGQIKIGQQGHQVAHSGV